MLFCFNTLHLLCQNNIRRVLSPTFKQHGPCVETTSRQDNTHYVPQQHTDVLNLHPVMCIGVLYCPPCVKITHEMRYKCCFNTCSSKQHTMMTLMWVISTWLFLQCILIVLLIAVCQHHFLLPYMYTENTAAWTTCKVLVLSGCTET